MAAHMVVGVRVSGGDEKSFGEEEVKNLGFIPVTGEAPPSCFCLEEDDDEEVS
jgi:hypothetical protein